MTGGKRRIKVGLVGLGRLGRIYARDLATRIPETRLVAVADPDEEALADVSATYDARPHASPERCSRTPRSRPSSSPARPTPTPT